MVFGTVFTPTLTYRKHVALAALARGVAFATPVGGYSSTPAPRVARNTPTAGIVMLGATRPPPVLRATDAGALKYAVAPSNM